jgi:hypothetical protein
MATAIDLLAGFGDHDRLRTCPRLPQSGIAPLWWPEPEIAGSLCPNAAESTPGPELVIVSASSVPESVPGTHIDG